jgi:DNA-binding transcriptional regulator LsrR (DeoR family)
VSTQDIGLLTRVASLYYLEDATQAEIAAQLGFSRPKVARLLQRARDDGIVEITIRATPDLNVELESEFANRFGLSQAVLVSDQRSLESQRRLVGRAGADLLTRTLQDGFVVAVGMGRNVGAIPEQLTGAPERSCTFVSAIGGSPQIETGVNSNDICRRLAEGFRGRVESLYAPPYAESVANRRTLLQHTDVRETLSRARTADVLIVGVGDARDDSAVVQMGCFSTLEMARMRKAGAVGDMLGFFFDVRGAPVEGSVQDRVVALSADDLRTIPRVIAVTSEPDKALALLGALHTGIPDIVITTVGTAEQVLATESEMGTR